MRAVGEIPLTTARLTGFWRNSDAASRRPSLLASGLAALGLLGWRRKRKNAATDQNTFNCHKDFQRQSLLGY